MNRLIKSLVLISSLMLLAACVTETTGRQQSVENTEEAAILNYQLGVNYLNNADWQRARVKLEKSIEQDSDNALAYTALGLAYQNLGDKDAAERNYRSGVALQPKNPQALGLLAVFLCGDPDSHTEALKLFDRALAVPLSETDSNKASLYTNAGVCIKMTDLAKAENYFRAALSSDPQYAGALIQMADVTFKRENPLQARAFLQRYLTVAPVSPEALWLGYEIEQNLGDFRAADKYGLQLRQEFPESVETRQLLDQLRDAG